jgi:glucose-6-phosphate 1-dehydrogenase
VQITVAEEIGIGTRAAFYEKAGVVRDMLQNHLLQLLCMMAMEPPVHYDGASLRDETLKVLRSVRPVDSGRDAVRGQYGPGAIRADQVPGYRQEQGIGRDSPTPTFVAARVFLDNWRWEGVPFFLRTGKRMERKLTEICIQFKPTPHLMFPVDPARVQGNLLVFRLAPHEGIIHVFVAKRPGPELTMCPVRMNFLYSTAFELEDAPRAYAWLLREVMQGDQTLFARADWIDQAWAIVDPILERWESMALTKDLIYTSGSWGPPAADRLIEGSGRAWRQI